MLIQSGASQPPLIIAGMHRSGTSLTAALLKSGGVHLGDRLMQPAFDNLKGHQENLDFVEFHMRVLESQGLHNAGWIAQGPVEVPDRLVSAAEALVRRSAQSGLWGWKDPRTTLFLKFWQQIVPEAKFVFVYRAPWEVIDSLFRRGDTPFQTYPERAIACWQHYNQSILSFYQAHRDRCFLFNVAKLSEAELSPAELSPAELSLAELRERLESKLDLHLSPFNADLFDPELIKTQWQTAGQYRRVMAALSPESLALLEMLSAESDWPLQSSPVDESEHQQPSTPSVQSPTSPQVSESAAPISAPNLLAEVLLEQWMLSRKHQKKAEETEVEVKQLRQAAIQRQVQLDKGASDLTLAQNHIQNLQNQAVNLRAQIAGLNEQLQTCRHRLSTMQTELSRQEGQSAFLSESLKQNLHQSGAAAEKIKTLQTRLELRQTHVDDLSRQLATLHQRLNDTHQQLTHAHHQFNLLHGQLEGIQQSKFWQMRDRWFSVRRALGLGNEHLSAIDNLKQRFSSTPSIRPADSLPPALTPLSLPPPLPLPPLPNIAVPSARSEETKPTTEGVRLPGFPRAEDPQYQIWLNQNYPTPATLQQLQATVDFLPNQPLFSLIMPVYNPAPHHLSAAIESVLAQIYPHWELCIADDASTEAEVRATLERYSLQDSRIRVVYREENGHISACSNSALELAQGEFIGLLDHDDLLTPHALYENAVLLSRQPKADLVYSDEDKVDERGWFKDPFFKPDWSPDSLLGRMYTSHFSVYRRALVEKLGGFRLGYEGSQDYDLALRFTELTSKVFHIPKVLYHWREHPQSAAGSADQKPYAAIAAEKALSEALERRKEPGRLVPTGNIDGHFVVRYEIREPEKVSIIIPTRDLAQTLNTCLTSIFEKSTYPNYEVLLIDNGSVEPETHQLIERWQRWEPDRFRCHPYNAPFNYSKINNLGAAKATGKYLLFLNNDTEVITPDWLEALVEQAQRPSVGAVGALLLYPDDTVQHAGVVAGIGGVAGHSHKFFAANEAGYFNRLQTINNYSALTAACLLCRKAVFETVGGFEEQLTVAFNDVDLCFKIQAKGLNNLYHPHAKLYHYESKSRGFEDTPEKQMRFKQEIEYMQKTWAALIRHDPCYNPNLTIKGQDYSLRLLEDGGV